jgi:hypothetical protein
MKLRFLGRPIYEESRIRADQILGLSSDAFWQASIGRRTASAAFSGGCPSYYRRHPMAEKSDTEDRMATPARSGLNDIHAWHADSKNNGGKSRGRYRCARKGPLPIEAALREDNLEQCNTTEKIVSHCDEAMAEIQRELPTGDLWERRWASLLALLRTACETLRKGAPVYWQAHMVSPNAGKKGRDSKNNWEPEIFGKFIWTDSNLFLHQGVMPESQSIMPHGPNMQKQVQGVTASQTQGPLPPPVSYHMNIEPYVGRGALEVAAEAVDWLKDQIAIAEKGVKP